MFSFFKDFLPLPFVLSSLGTQYHEILWPLFFNNVSKTVINVSDLLLSLSTMLWITMVSYNVGFGFSTSTYFPSFSSTFIMDSNFCSYLTLTSVNLYSACGVMNPTFDTLSM